MITEKLRAIRQKIEKTCTKIGRDPDGVQLLLATKTVTSERIKKALLAGYTLIGENKVQELKQKAGALKELHPQHHFIGHLQTNKIKELLKHDIACLQSVDRFDLASKLDEKLRANRKTLDIFIQVNTSGEPSKFGALPADAVELIKKIALLPSLRIKGLMTIGQLSADKERVRPCFRLLKDLQLKVAALHIPNVVMNELSMGMSNDFEIAIEEGATIIRVGTAIFGDRGHPDSYYWNELSARQ